MKNYKKYFNFEGTISGTNYLLRNLLSGIVSFFGGYFIGYGMIQNIGLMTIIGFLIVLFSLWFSIATIYKRVSALFEGNMGIITLLIVMAQLMGVALGDEHPISIFTKLGLILFGLFLIFYNSSIENHNG